MWEKNRKGDIYVHRTCQLSRLLLFIITWPWHLKFLCKTLGASNRWFGLCVSWLIPISGQILPVIPRDQLTSQGFAPLIVCGIQGVQLQVSNRGDKTGIFVVFEVHMAWRPVWQLLLICFQYSFEPWALCYGVHHVESADRNFYRHLPSRINYAGRVGFVLVTTNYAQTKAVTDQSMVRVHRCEAEYFATVNWSTPTVINSNAVKVKSCEG